MQTTSTSKGYSAEPSPEGHWSKNFAALSVHRRKDWVATAKGFNKYVWDFENKPNKENVYGLYASHGALLIANSEALLSVHDVDNGWDWAKIPGTTSIALDLADMNMGGGRFFGQRDLAGGLTFKGTYPLGNGVFGMDFNQPSYGLATSDWRHNIVFKFKKSFFFFQNLIVGLGSHISAQNTNSKIVQTTLFQDKLIDGVSSSKIKVNGEDKTYSDMANAYTPNKANVAYTTLTDAKGNFYYIPGNSKTSLKVHLKDQNSKTDNGKTDTTGRYATAWFDHSSSPNNVKYQYAVLIPTATYHTTLTDLATAQESANDKVYKVLKQDRQAHVVQFVKSPKTWIALGSDHVVTGYVLFRENLNLPSGGEIAHVTAKNVLLMVEKSDDYIFLSVSVPSLNLHTKDDLEVNNDVQQEERYHSSSQEKEVEVTLRTRVESGVVYALAHGNPDCYKPNVWVVGNNLKVKFLNLKNGFSVEVKLKKITV